MHRIHGGLTVVAPITGDPKELRKQLRLLHNRKDPSPFEDSSTTLFASGFILPGQEYHSEADVLPESLVFATTYCGPLAAHLSDLWRTNKDNLGRLFSFCEGYGDRPTEKLFVEYIRKYSHSGTFCSRYNYITKEEVALEKGLRKEIEKYIDDAQKLDAFRGLKPVQVKTLICRHLKAQGDKYEWAFKPFRKNFWEWLQTAWISLLKVVLVLSLFSFLIAIVLCLISLAVPTLLKVFAAAFIILFVSALLVVGVLWYINRHKTPAARRPGDCRVRAIAATQLNPVVNGMAAAAPLKKGIVRRHFYYLALKAVGLVAHKIIKVPTVSSIRWLSVDNKKRLLFLSNYSNTTDFYVRDFLIGHTPKGVNFMFSNGLGFPDATLSFIGGIRKYPEEYMNAVHTGQHVMDLWYTHENALTVDMINRNRAIRNGLAKKMNDRNAAAWLRLL